MSCIGKSCVSRFAEYECEGASGCAARRILQRLAEGPAHLPEGSGGETGNRFGNLLAGLGLAEGRWPTRETEAGVHACRLSDSSIDRRAQGVPR